MTFGREVFGEPKKLAPSRLARDGSLLRGRIERGGIPLVSVEAELEADHGPAQAMRLAFNYRARSAVTGIGLDGPAVLTRPRSRHDLMRGPQEPARAPEIRTARPGRGDPGTREPRRGVPGSLTRCELCARSRGPAEGLLPHHLGRQDAWRLLDPGSPSNRA